MGAAAAAGAVTTVEVVAAAGAAAGQGQQFLLAFEIVVDQPGRHAGATGDDGQRRAVQSLAPDRVDRGIHELVATDGFDGAFRHESIQLI